jgi:hypothetical protein
MRGLKVLLLSLAAILVLVPLADAGPHTPANLVQTRVTTSGPLAPGSSISVVDTVRNVGGSAVRNSVTGFYLKDSGRSIRIGHRRVGRLAPGGRSVAHHRHHIPTTLPAATYDLFA